MKKICVPCVWIIFSTIEPDISFVRHITSLHLISGFWRFWNSAEMILHFNYTVINHSTSFKISYYNLQIETIFIKWPMLNNRRTWTSERPFKDVFVSKVQRSEEKSRSYLSIRYRILFLRTVKIWNQSRVCWRSDRLIGARSSMASRSGCAEIRSKNTRQGICTKVSN